MIDLFGEGDGNKIKVHGFLLLFIFGSVVSKYRSYGIFSF
jgi:hypothetical protein